MFKCALPGREICDLSDPDGRGGAGGQRGPRQAKSSEDLLAGSSSYDHMNEIVLIERELELLHMSRHVGDILNLPGSFVAPSIFELTIPHL